MNGKLHLSELAKDTLTDEIIDKVLYDISSCADGSESADVIIVLGSKKAWTYRIPAAAMLFADGCAPALLLTGGKVQQSGYGLLPEWESMRIAAERLGVPRSAIITEKQSLSTLENFRYCKKIIAEKLPDCRTAMIVTTAYHMRRALLIAERELPYLRLLPVPVQKGSATRENWRETDKGRATAAEEVMKISRLAADGNVADYELCELYRNR